MEPYPIDQPSIIVQAGMGIGKSKQESVYLKELVVQYGTDNLIIVKLSHRTAFTAQEVKRLGDETGLSFISNQDVGNTNINLHDHPFLVIQYESLHRLLHEWGLHDKKLVLLCDEINSLMRQMESIAGSPADDMLMFQGLIEFSSHCVFMDACINTNVVEACKSFLQATGKEPPHLIINTYKRHTENKTKVTMFDDDKMLLLEVHATIRSGERVVITTHSRSKAEKIQYGIEHLFPDKRLKIYTGATPGEIKAEDFRDVNETWKDVDVVIYNSTCEAGISCVIPEFENVFGFYRDDIVSVEVTKQILGRIRCGRNIRVHVKCKSQSLAYAESLPIDRKSIFKQYTSL